MALLYQAELRPSKIELIEAWAPTQPWFAGSAGATFSNVGSFRFDDPAGEVGIETILVRAGDGPLLQVPLTYRGAELEGADEWLIGTMAHSVLGRRWVYDGAGDPAYLTAVATAALTSGGQAQLHIDIDGERVVREPTAFVVGSGTPAASVPVVPAGTRVSTRSEQGRTVVEASDLRLVVLRVLGAPGATMRAFSSQEVLSGTWSGQAEPRALVLVQAAPVETSVPADD
ncbi:hypothetical protein E3T26_05605 [Cryobacterium sp. TMT1-21]|uniref:Maltokinase N-terminal cap domain-containing protein n=1 Tax=Cryobacterium shii TaxID=1259235 RepID=A0AAQ2C7X1_9MICO|nr:MULTISPECIES: hypothetical protein [Cryobacterium]TFC51659.1 hypothetical protein E3O49_03185 [Cryobacterium shii]TFC83654.1 hypothetical protein E3T24_11690 [Cryobacterium sp. TmT2-59]TFD16011.1 hypothetical protein E3T26_05605 [Cryobacterium sp. TMT1-21]TFD38262.1 hypothetical protein E3T37_10285 [Cryobacterium sp. TMT2-10]